MTTKAFHRVTVDRLNTMPRISWLLRDDFDVPPPYIFRVQLSGSPSANDNDWDNISGNLVNQFYFVDSVRNRYAIGSVQRSYYRVVLIDSQNNIYKSEAVPDTGALTVKQWYLARELLRKENLRVTWSTFTEGYLLKLMVKNMPCTRCLDRFTKEPMDPKCPVCKGTGRIKGYYSAVPAYILFDPDTSNLKRNLEQMGGTVNEMQIMATSKGFPFIDSQDIWVNKTTDDRYIVREVQTVAAVNGFPIVEKFRLALLPITDPAYSLPVPAN
jgi:hypothetical protein